MKKLFNIALSALVMTMAASCTQEHIDAQLLPENIVAPILGEVTGGILTAEAPATVIDYTAASYGLQTIIGYTLYIDVAGNNMASKRKLAADIAQGKITVKARDINMALLNLDIEPEQEVSAEFMLESAMLNNKNAIVSGSEAPSNVVSAKFTTYDAEVNDVDAFEHVWVIGNYCDWKHDKTQFLYDYNKTGTEFSGVVDFADKAAKGFKLTDAPDWDHGNFGWNEADDATLLEPESIILLSGGGSKDIMVYARRFYKFTFNKSTLVLTKDWSADQISIVGLNNEWEKDIVMEYNAYKHRFYADIDVASNTEMKFRADGKWDLCWGAKQLEGVEGEDNIAVDAGQYRVYLDLNKATAEFSDKMYGKDEPTESGSTKPDPEPEPEPDPDPTTTVKHGRWSLIGNVNEDTTWSVDYYMTPGENGKYYSDVVNITGGFKIRFDATWDSKIDRGTAAGATAVVGTPFEVAQGGGNFSVDPGLYIVVYDEVNQTVTINDATKGWHMIGDALTNGWDKDSHGLYETEPGIFVSSPVYLKAGTQGFKLRKDNSWDEPNNRGGVFAAFGEAFDAVPNGGNICASATEAAWVVVTYDSNTEKITVDKFFDNRWSVIGDINGVTWSEDVPCFLIDGVWKSAPFVSDKEFKIRFGAAWDIDRGPAGGVTPVIGEPFAVEKGPNNISGLTGYLRLVYDPTKGAETITVSEYK